MEIRFERKRLIARILPAFASCGLIAIAGCAGAPGGSGSTEDKFQGELSGSVASARTTRESVDTANGVSAQVLPTNFDPAVAVVLFEDVAGNVLLNANGQPFPPVSIDTAGTFAASNLPIGENFVISVDLDGDGNTDISHMVQIPADATGRSGKLDNVVVDPLTTLVVAELRSLFQENGINPDDLGVSLTAIVERVIDSFTHLFEENGIEQSVTLADLEGVPEEDLSDLFDTFVPESAQTGIDTFLGTVSLERASELADVVAGAARIFLRAGFPIEDAPGGFDLSFLGTLDNVNILTFAELVPPFDAVTPDSDTLTTSDIDLILAATSLDQATIDQLYADGIISALLASGELDQFIIDGQLDPNLDVTQLEALLTDTLALLATAQTLPEPIIYVSTVGEPDRNFGMNKEFDVEGEGHYLPILTEHLLAKMAALHLENRTISLRNLHRLLTDVDVGLGARITYSVPFFDRFQEPGLVFESADGTGIIRNIEQLLFNFKDSGLFSLDADFDSLVDELQAIRAAMRDLLIGTKAPTVFQLFGAILSDRVESIAQLFSFIRKARTHLPFNLSGPSAFYVVADGDPFNSNGTTVNAVTVNVDFDSFGHPTAVVYNPNHAGEFLLGFAGTFEGDRTVELLVRETGRFLHGQNGEPVVLDMNDGSIFGVINGLPFVDFVTESGTFFHGVPVSVPNPEYRLGDESLGLEGPTFQLFVLATGPSPDAEPVRVNYDVTTETFSADVNGRYYMMFVPETETQNLFGLFDIELNFLVGVNDLTVDRFVDFTDPAFDTTATGTLKQRIGQSTAAQTADGTTTTDPTVTQDPTFAFVPVLLNTTQVANLATAREFFEFIYGTEVPNENFIAAANPYFDDVNGNGVEDTGEFTADFRPTLFDPDDWRSTDVGRYYRRADGRAVIIEEVDFSSLEPRTFDGIALVARSFLPRRNAFRFGRPNTAINLLTTFLPSEFFDGTRSFTEDTRLDIFQALAMINLVMEQMLNVEAVFDVDGPGPIPSRRTLIDARIFVLPLGDPFVLLLDGFITLSEPTE